MRPDVVVRQRVTACQLCASRLAVVSVVRGRRGASTTGKTLVTRSHDPLFMTYPESLRNMEKMAELRFFRDCACRDDAELETTEGVMDSVDDCLDLRSDSGRSVTF
jgi:hypothetical protein